MSHLNYGSSTKYGIAFVGCSFSFDYNESFLALEIVILSPVGFEVSQWLLF